MSGVTYEMKALTDIWTGDIDGKRGRLITTGLLGSIRWWFEVLVRGLDGGACDPTQHSCVDRNHCVVCELFGCTGWARKFRFDVLDTKDRPRQAQITKDAKFKLRFTPLRSICDKEWALLDLTLRLIADYGALGGKTVYKPTDEVRRQAEPHHQDFGLVKLIHGPDVSKFSKDELRAYMRDWLDVGGNGFAWASLKRFWFVRERVLARQAHSGSTFNSVLGRDERKLCKDCGMAHERQKKCPSTGKFPRRYSSDNPNTDPDKWLAGRQGNSKKVFSFREPARTFGFVAPGTISHDDMRQRLSVVWPDLEDREYEKGATVFDGLLEATEASR